MASKESAGACFTSHRRIELEDELYSSEESEDDDLWYEDDYEEYPEDEEA